VLNDGRVLNGLLAGESATSIELIDAQARRIPILREDIDELTRSGNSLMPDGFEKLLSRSEFRDLLEYLTDPGSSPKSDAADDRRGSSEHSGAGD
jgi:putative heme-binding domain-containing protein